MTAVDEVGSEGAEHLAALHAAAFDIAWTASTLRDLLDSPGVLALHAGENGFILLRQALDEAEVLTLAVRPSARRCGVGTALVEASARRLAARGATALHLEVAADNAAALALYARAGFAPAGLRRGYYARAAGAAAVDAVVMTRPLNSSVP